MCFLATFAKFLRTTSLQNTFTTLRAIDRFLINKYLARLMALLMLSFKYEKIF